MQSVDSREAEYAIGMISDGNVFERFAQEFLANIQSIEFIPIGGVKDRGIDGLERCFQNKLAVTCIYQISIEKDTENKILKTVDALKKNKIKFSKLAYVTNQEVKNPDQLIEQFYSKYNINLSLIDRKHIAYRVNNNQGTLTAYNTFINSYLHRFEKPNVEYVGNDLVNDPRLYIFLQQQVMGVSTNTKTDEFLADTLILFSLKETDPDKGKVLTKDEIKDFISHLFSFDAERIVKKIDERIDQLCEKPRKIKFDSRFSGYLLPFETRNEINQKYIQDKRVYDSFCLESNKKIKHYLKDENVRVADCHSLIEKAIHKIYYQQGLEFSQLIVSGQCPETFDKNLPEVISQVVEESRIVPKNKAQVKNALLLAIREIVYNGSEEEKKFLFALSQTYTMLFLLQCEPHVSNFFEAMASELEVYVCASIIIPALSEYFLEPRNKRYWALLKGARAAGVKLIVNESIVEELANHFRHIKNQYVNEYNSDDDFFSEDDIASLYVKEIMLRAFFYSRSRNKALDFRSFMNNFVDPSFSSLEEDIIEFLKGEFGIQFIPDSSVNIFQDPKEISLISTELEKVKKHKDIAINHAKIALAVYYLREKKNEKGNLGVFGYKTWWLTQDVKTFLAVRQHFSEKYNVTCYIRPDFLFNYISISPKKQDVDSVFSQMFPSLLGVSISYHIPPEIFDLTHKFLLDHKEKTPVRIKSILRNLADQLKSDPDFQDSKKVKHYLDNELESIIKFNPSQDI